MTDAEQELSDKDAEYIADYFMRKAIDDLKNRSEFVGWTFPGGEAKINEAENRLQLLFDEKPPEDQRRALKSEGFKWAPSQGAWQPRTESEICQNVRR